MGRIKSTLIKRTAKGMLKEQNKFDDTFDTAKKILGRSMPSKSLRNKIAGYIARLNTMEREKKSREIKRKEENIEEYNKKQ